MNELLARLPNTVQLPPHLATNEGEWCVPHDLRRFARKKVRGEMVCQIVGVLPSVPRSPEIKKVHSLDMSRCGFSFLMDQQLYPGEEVLLWTPIGRIPCEVARCLKHNDRCYEVGVAVRK